ncbi:MAG TPA: nucleoside 2-deoxyribosyltransferase [Xanthobacteraceae bacterium]
MARKNVYLASALFSDSERRANEQIATLLEKWFDVFLPQRDGRLIAELIAEGMKVDAAYSHVFGKDIEAIHGCDAIMINLDGRTVDEGAAFELGFAFANGKVCVGYRTDVRVLLPWGLNPMLTAPLERVFRSDLELESWCATFAASKSNLSATG